MADMELFSRCLKRSFARRMIRDVVKRSERKEDSKKSFTLDIFERKT